MRTRAGVPLSEVTTVRLGGPAEALVEAETDADVVEAVADAAARGVPVLVLSGGSNLLVSDSGFPGTVLAVRTSGIDVRRVADGEVEVTVAAGEDWDGVVRRCVAECWAGVECLAGIPGAAGATPIQNVGAYGQDVSATITRVRVLERATGAVSAMTAAECGFGYRVSRFKNRDDYVVLDVTYRLREQPLSMPVRYAELARTLGVQVGDPAPLGEVSEAVVGLRRGKGMVLDPSDPDTYSCGSFFTNPVVGADVYEDLAARAPAGRSGGTPVGAGGASGGAAPVPHWADAGGLVKLSAAWLIQQAGFERGYGHGDARISSKHTLALTNRGSATTADLLALAREIRDGVRDRFGVTLHPEPVLVGVSLD